MDPFRQDASADNVLVEKLLEKRVLTTVPFLAKGSFGAHVNLGARRKDLECGPMLTVSILLEAGD